MKIIFGTTNEAKLSFMQQVLKGMDIQLVGLKELSLQMHPAREDGRDPLENAIQKAKEYYEFYRMPIFSADSGLYFEGIGEAYQPGVLVRRFNENNADASDEEMIRYYSHLAHKNGGKIIARYINAICLIYDNDNVFTYMGDQISSERFYIGDKPHHKRTPGFPLNSLSIEIQSGKYYYDIKEQNDKNKTSFKGYKSFFNEALLKIQKL